MIRGNLNEEIFCWISAFVNWMFGVLYVSYIQLFWFVKRASFPIIIISLVGMVGVRNRMVGVGPGESTSAFIQSWNFFTQNILRVWTDRLLTKDFQTWPLPQPQSLLSIEHWNLNGRLSNKNLLVDSKTR